MKRMVATTDLTADPSKTTTVPIAIPAHTIQFSSDQIPGERAQFVADNTSVLRIENVINENLGADGCDYQVYYFKRTPFRFLVVVTLRYSIIAGSKFIAIFAKTEPEITITPLAENLVSTDLEAINPAYRERLHLVRSHGGELGNFNKVIYLYTGKEDRIAS